MTYAYIYEEFGNQLRNIRERLGMTQQQLADSSDFSRTSISNIESGKQRILLHQMYEFADILNVPSTELLPTTLHTPRTLRRKALSALPENQAEFVSSFLGRGTRVHG